MRIKENIYEIKITCYYISLINTGLFCYEASKPPNKLITKKLSSHEIIWSKSFFSKVSIKKMCCSKSKAFSVSIDTLWPLFFRSFLFWLHLKLRSTFCNKICIFWGEWPSGLRRSKKDLKFPVWNTTRCLAGFREPASLRGSRWTLGWNR